MFQLCVILFFVGFGISNAKNVIVGDFVDESKFDCVYAIVKIGNNNVLFINTWFYEYVNSRF